MKIAVFGNTVRFDILCRELKNAGYEVRRYNSADEIPERMEEKILVLPIPTKTKDGFLNIGKGDERITVEEVIGRTDPSALIIACNYSDITRNIVDINKQEDFAFLNAVPTAEGAIHIAVSNLGLTMFRSRCLIIGFGRIGKILADRLHGLRSSVSVAARNPKDIAHIKALGLEAVDLSQIEDRIAGFDVVFQTVPSLILSRSVLKNTSKNCLIIELSSGSAGTDLTAAEQLGIKVINAPGLPEKTAPVTAGMILFESVIRIINEYERKTD